MFERTPLVLGRQGRVPPESKGPIWVTTTNDALDAVCEAVPPPRRPDLIFLQNGMLLPWLRRRGLQHNTQVLLYMSAAADGSVVDGKRTVAAGPWAPHVCSVLQRGGVACDVVGWEEYQRRMAEKLLWASIFWMMSAALGGMKVGDIARHHEGEVAALVEEMLPIASHYIRQQHQQQQQQQEQCQGQEQGSRGGESGQRSSSSASSSTHSAQGGSNAAPHQASGALCGAPSDGAAAAVLPALLEYSLAISEAVPSASMAYSEFSWRNGWFLSEGGLQACPLHLHWLRRAGCPATLLEPASLAKQRGSADTFDGP